MSKPPKHFRNYILSYLGDRDYEKVIETVTKIHKAFDKDAPAMSTADTGLPHFSFPLNFCLLSSIRFSLPTFSLLQ